MCIDVTFFILLTITAVVGIIIASKMKLECWKIQIILIVFYEFLGVVLLLFRLANR